jgi:crotonobetainyl-CoA:carnitine CoA-transferase CaiB-like acyl-CoA transferase
MTENAPGAMTGLRVIDLTRVLGGPYCTQILADHGATLSRASAHTLHRGDVIEKGWYKGVASPIRFERSKASLRDLPPKFNAHSAAMLAELGYSEGEIDALFASGGVCGPERKR